MADLRPFQRDFVKRALSPRVDTAALSLPRGNGKSWLAAEILTRCLTPRDDLFEAGKEYILCAGSLEQARIVFRFLRANLESSGGYRWLDSNTRIGAVHLATNTRLRIMSSNAKTAMGIVNCPLLVADEPGSWETIGGELMHDAITTAQGKPGSPLRVIYIGTLAPAMAGWWHDLIDAGSRGRTYVQAIKGDPEKWDDWREIRRCNPLTAISKEFRDKLREELEAAKSDTRLKARFLSYRLNVPSADESTMLLNVPDWQRVLERDILERDGQPAVGIDLGGGRAWSAAVAMWRTGRVEAVACAPGVPSIEAQEKRDRVPSGTYRALADMGQLRIAHGKRVQPPGELVQAIVDTWGQPLFAVCDRFREADLRDAAPDWEIDARVTRWSEASADIRALRRMSLDGDMNVADGSRELLTASLAVAMVKNDDAGNVRLVKKGTANTSRDDVAAALTLVAGAVDRLKPWNAVVVPAYSGFTRI